MFQRVPILYRIIIPFVLLVLIGAGTLVTYFVFTMTTSLMTGTRRNLETITFLTTGTIAAESGRLLSSVDAFLAFPQTREMLVKGDVPGLSSLLIPFMARKRFDLVAAIGPDGRPLVMLSTGKEIADLKSYPLVRQGMLGMSRDGLIKTPERTLLAAISPNETQTQGIQGGLLVAADFRERIGNLITGLPVEIALFGMDGRPLSLVGKASFPAFQPSAESLQEIRFGRNVFLEVSDSRGKPYLAILSPLVIHGSLEGALGVFHSLEDVYSMRSAYLSWIVILSLVGMTLIFLIGLKLTRSINNPIQKLLEGVRAIEAGDFNVHVPVEGHDELARLTISFNTMIRQLREEMFLLRRSLDDAKEANRTRTRFVAMISHELKTPLSVILGYLTLIEDNNLGDPGPEMITTVRIIRKRAEELHRLIENILLVTRVERGETVVPRLAVIDPVEVIRESIADNAFAAEQKNVALRLEGTTAPSTFRTDPDFLKEILVNLISNAVKFTPSGGKVTVTVSRPGDGSERSLSFTVTDTGVGIPEQYFEKIFEPFFQIDSTLERSYGGAGLGLYIVKEMTSLLGGRVFVESDPGKGSRFMVHLPQGPRESAPPAPPGASVPPSQG